MGSGGSKKQELQPDGGGRERRPSHVDTNPPPQSDILVECPICGRKFAKDRIQRHMEVCKAAQDKKPRDVFDVQGQRLQGTEAEGNLNSLRRENSNDLGMTMTNWKSQHDQHLREIQDAKKKNSRERPQSAFGNVEIFEGKRR